MNGAAGARDGAGVGVGTGDDAARHICRSFIALYNMYRTCDG